MKNVSPIHIGRPSDAYPWPWSIVPWLEGETADLAPPADDQSRALAVFLRALHQPAPPNAPPNPFRGVPLGQQADIFALHQADQELSRLQMIEESLDPATITHLGVADIYRTCTALPLDVSKWRVW